MPATDDERIFRDLRHVCVCVHARASLISARAGGVSYVKGLIWAAHIKDTRSFFFYCSRTLSFGRCIFYGCFSIGKRFLLAMGHAEALRIWDKFFFGEVYILIRTCTVFHTCYTNYVSYIRSYPSFFRIKSNYNDVLYL